MNVFGFTFIAVSVVFTLLFTVYHVAELEERISKLEEKLKNK